MLKKKKERKVFVLFYFVWSNYKNDLMYSIRIFSKLFLVFSSHLLSEHFMSNWKTGKFMTSAVRQLFP